MAEDDVEFYGQPQIPRFAPSQSPAFVMWVGGIGAQFEVKVLCREVRIAELVPEAASGPYHWSTTSESQGQERIDKENVYRWKSDRRRLESEGVRDCMLFVSGQLDSRFGGIDLDPAREWETRRRSLYYTIYPESGGMMQFLTLFDAPDPCDCYRRTETTVPQQALALSNSRLALILGRQLAARLAVETRQGTRVGDDETFIIALFETVLSRGPRPSELGFCREFLQRQEQLTRDLPEAELKSPAEKGVVPGSTNPRQRARESLVRVLLNHNEFITIQ